MVRGILHKTTLAALILVPAIASAGIPTIPKEFLGEWNADLSQCGKGTEESFLMMEPHQVSFWESSGPVRAAIVLDRELALILELFGEGERWLSATQFELSADGKVLTWESSSGEKFVRFLCSTSRERPNNSFKRTAAPKNE